jgi:BlaI family transcriptional regulator, penicillinase repressor
MKPLHPKISDAEWEVMSLLWERAPAAASDLITQLQAKRGWSSRTIRTLLDRLVKKGALGFEVDGKRYLYSPRVTMNSCVRKESQSFLRRVFGGEPASMLIHLVKTTRLSPDQIQELKRILSEKEK